MFDIRLRIKVQFIYDWNRLAPVWGFNTWHRTAWSPHPNVVSGRCLRTSRPSFGESPTVAGCESFRRNVWYTVIPMSWSWKDPRVVGIIYPDSWDWYDWLGWLNYAMGSVCVRMHNNKVAWPWTSRLAQCSTAVPWLAEGSWDKKMKHCTKMQKG